MDDKLLWSEDMEQCVIGCLLLGGAAADMVIKRMEIDWFYVEKCRHIYRVATKNYGDVKPDLILVCQWLTNEGILTECGGQHYLVDCMDKVSTAAHTEHYIGELRKLYFDRQIQAALYEVTKDPSPEKIELLRIKREQKDGTNAEGILNLKDCIPKVVELTEPLAKGVYEIFGMKENDEYHNGMTAGDILTIGARPRVGKTVMAVHVAVNFARRYKEPVLYFSTEMTYTETLQRMLAPLSGVPGWKFRKRYFDKEGEDIRKIGCAAEELSNLNIFVVDKPAPTLSQIRAAMSATGARLVILDYLQVVNLEVEREEGIPAAIGRFLYGFKSSLNGLGALGVVLCQLARETDRLTKKQSPQLADLKGSGDIEQISNSVLLMWQNNKKDRDTKLELVPEIRNVKAIEMIHAKHRTVKSDVSVQMIFDENQIEFFEWNNEIAERYNKDIIPRAKKEKKQNVTNKWGTDSFAGGGTTDPDAEE